MRKLHRKKQPVRAPRVQEELLSSSLRQGLSIHRQLVRGLDEPKVEGERVLQLEVGVQRRLPGAEALDVCLFHGDESPERDLHRLRQLHGVAGDAPRPAHRSRPPLPRKLAAKRPADSQNIRLLEHLRPDRRERHLETDRAAPFRMGRHGPVDRNAARPEDREASFQPFAARRGRTREDQLHPRLGLADRPHPQLANGRKGGGCGRRGPEQRRSGEKDRNGAHDLAESTCIS